MEKEAISHAVRYRAATRRGGRSLSAVVFD